MVPYGRSVRGSEPARREVRGGQVPGGSEPSSTTAKSRSCEKIMLFCLDGGAPLATRGLCASRGVWCSYRPKFEIGVVELLARKRKLAIAPGTTGTRPLGGRTEMLEFGDPSKSRTSRFRAVNTPLGYFGLYGDEDEHAQTF